MVHQFLSFSFFDLPLGNGYSGDKKELQFKIQGVQIKTLCYINIFSAFCQAHWKVTWKPIWWVPTLSFYVVLSQKGSKGFFLYPCDPHSLHIHYLHYRSILRIYPKDWESGSGLFEVILVPGLRITLCYQKSLFTLSATFYILTYIHYPQVSLKSTSTEFCQGFCDNKSASLTPSETLGSNCAARPGHFWARLGFWGVWCMFGK